MPNSGGTPSLCGAFLSNKRSLIAFTWTLTTVLTLVAFILALAMVIHIHTHYIRMEHYYQEQWSYANSGGDDYYSNGNNNNNNNQQNQEREGEGGSGDQGGGGSGDQGGEHRLFRWLEGGAGEGGATSADKEAYEMQLLLSQMSSKSMAFVALYTVSMAIALQLYGSTAIVGFTSLRGVYIAPCFSYPSSSRLKVGIFGGAIIVFANLLLVCAVIFGEVRVEDWQEQHNRDGEHQEERESEPYEVERIATVLAATCIFLAALYTIFAILLFLYYGSEDKSNSLDDDAENDTAVVGVHGRTTAMHLQSYHHATPTVAPYAVATGHHKSSSLSGVGVGSNVNLNVVANAAHAGDPRRENFITME